MLILKKKNRLADDKNKEYKELRTVVDSIMEDNKPHTESMTNSYDRFCGKIWDEEKLSKFDSRAFINFEFSTVEAIAPLLTDNPPIWSVIPHYPYLNRLGGLYKNGLKYLWDIMEMGQKMLLANMDAMLAKVGILMAYYHSGEDQVKTDLVDPREFFLAPGYTDIWEAPLCGRVGFRPISWIRQRFPEVTKSDLKIDKSYIPNDTDVSKYGGDKGYKGHTQFTKVYEIWCRDDTTMEDIIENDEKKGEKQAYPYGKMIYLLEDKFLGEEAQDAKHGKPPFVQLYDYIVPHRFLGISEGDQIEGLNKELNLQLQYMMGYTRKYNNPNYIADAGSGIDPDQLKDAVEKGGQVLTANYMYDQGTRKAAEILTMPGLIPEVGNFFSILPRVIEEMTGVTDVSKGMATKKERQSASEVAIQYEASQTRTRQRIRNNEWTLKRLCYLWVHLMQQYWTEPRNIHWKDAKTGGKIYDQLGNSRALAESVVGGEEEQDRADLEKLMKNFDSEIDPVYFDFDIEIETNSTLPMDKQSKANMAIRLFELGAIDRAALLETVQFPKGAEIAERMDQKEMEMQGGGPEEMAMPSDMEQMPQEIPTEQMPTEQGEMNE